LLLGLLLLLREFVLPVSISIKTLRVIASGGVAITINDWRTANRWDAKEHPSLSAPDQLKGRQMTVDRATRARDFLGATRS
jgi:hypothetical protein